MLIRRRLPVVGKVWVVLFYPAFQQKFESRFQLLKSAVFFLLDICLILQKRIHIAAVCVEVFKAFIRIACSIQIFFFVCQMTCRISAEYASCDICCIFCNLQFIQRVSACFVPE